MTSAARRGDVPGQDPIPVAAAKLFTGQTYAPADRCLLLTIVALPMTSSPAWSGR